MVFVFVPPHKGGRKSSRREDAIGLFIAAMIALGFAIFVGFFSWLHHAGDAYDAGQDNNSQEEQ